MTIKTSKNLMLLTVASLVINVASAQNGTGTAQPQAAQPAPANAAPAAKPSPISEAERAERMKQMKADQESMMKISTLSKEIKEAEKDGKAETPELATKKAELKKLQDDRNAKMKVEQEKRMKERAANPPAGQEDMMKISQLNKEIQEATKKGEGEKPEIVAKKAELKKLQDARNTKMKAEREKMMKEHPAPSPEEMEKMKKMGQLNKEIRGAEKEGKAETPEIVAKKTELKKMQDERMAKMKAEREKQMAEQKAAAPKPVEAKPATPATQEKK